MLRSLLNRFKPLPIATLDAGAAAGTIAAFTGGETYTTATLGAIATLAISLKLITGKFSDDQADQVARGVDRLLSSDRATAIELARLFELPTDANASNESAFLMLAIGLRDEIRQHGVTQETLDGLWGRLDELKEIAIDSQATSRETLEGVGRIEQSLADLTSRDELIAMLVGQLERKDAEIESLRAGESPEQVVREAVESIVPPDVSPEELSRLTPDEVQRRLIEENKQTEADYHEAEETSAQARQELASREEALIESDRRILHFAQLRGDVKETQFRIDRILERRSEDTDALNRRGYLRYVLGDLRGAEADTKQVLGLAVGIPSIQADAYGNLGLIYETRGDLDRAEEMHRQSLAISGELGRREGIAAAYLNLGLIYQKRGDLDRAEEMHRQSLTINEELGRREGVAAAYGNLGLIYETRGDLDRAEEMLRESLAIDKELGRREGIARTCCNLGVIYETRGDLDRAEEMLRESLAIDKELGHREGIANAYGNLGVIYEKRGDLDRAEEMLRESLAIDKELGLRGGMADDYGILGLIYQKRGDLDRAEEMLRAAFAINEELARRGGMASNCGSLGIVCSLRGQIKESREWLTRSRDLYSEIGIQQTAEQLQSLIDALPPSGRPE